MDMNFTSLNTQYSAEIISAIANENKNSSKSNVSSVYDSKNINVDAAVLSISSKGSARISAMMSKSIQLRACASNPELTAAERQKVNSELKELRREISSVEASADSKTPSVSRPKTTVDSVIDEDMTAEDADQMVEDNMQKILKNAEESIAVQNVNRDHVLQLL